jgi:hypothetical protein
MTATICFYFMQGTQKELLFCLLVYFQYYDDRHRTDGIIMTGELGGMWRDVVETYFRVLCRNIWNNQENHKNLSWYLVYWLRFIGKLPKYEPEVLPLHQQLKNKLMLNEKISHTGSSVGRESPSLMFQAAFLGRDRGGEWADGNKAVAPS